MKLVIATHNKDKLLEIKRAFSSIQWDVLSLHDFVDIDEIVEDGKTLVDNALIKARTVFEKTNLPVLSDDTGLEVDALDGCFKWIFSNNGFRQFENNEWRNHAWLFCYAFIFKPTIFVALYSFR